MQYAYTGTSVPTEVMSILKEHKAYCDLCATLDIYFSCPNAHHVACALYRALHAADLRQTQKPTLKTPLSHQRSWQSFLPTSRVLRVTIISNGTIEPRAEDPLRTVLPD